MTFFVSGGSMSLPDLRELEWEVNGLERSFSEGAQVGELNLLNNEEEQWNNLVDLSAEIETQGDEASDTHREQSNIVNQFWRNNSFESYFDTHPVRDITEEELDAIVEEDAESYISEAYLMQGHRVVEDDDGDSEVSATFFFQDLSDVDDNQEVDGSESSCESNLSSSSDENPELEAIMANIDINKGNG